MTTPTGRTSCPPRPPLLGPYPEGYGVADFGLGCFWGAERKFWQLPAGVCPIGVA